MSHSSLLGGRTREERFEALARELDCHFNDDFNPAGKYVPVVQCGDQIFLSGQLPKVGSEIMVTGVVGADVSMDTGVLAARICCLRALAVLRWHLGGLDRIRTVAKMALHVQSAPGFVRHSEIADGASEILHAVIGQGSAHARTSLGVLSLPRNAAVEIELIAMAHGIPAT